MVIWFTGLPASGKSTLAEHLEKKLQMKGFKTYLMDGDVLRAGLSSDLGFSDKDRSENIRRAAEVARLLANAGIIVLASFISPFKKDRMKARKILEGQYVEVFVDCPLEICETRDPKGLYKKARAGVIEDFTGISSPYEIPSSPDIIIATDQLSIEQSVDILERQVLMHLS